MDEEVADAAPGAQIGVFPDGGLLLELEQVERYFQIVSSFIERLDG